MRVRVLRSMFLVLAALLVFQSSAYSEEKPLKVTQEDMIYFIMTDRFNDGDTSNDYNVRSGDAGAYHGGDFQGVIDKLDYIKGLGFTAIWITPVTDNQTGGYHGYWTIDFYKTDEHLGTVGKLGELVQKAHRKGIKVIVDLVVNHTGQLTPWLDDPEYKNWFHEKKPITDYNNQDEVENGWLADLPDLNQDNPETRKYLIDMAKWWIEKTGIDGYRLDTVRHVPKDFWVAFTREIKKVYPDFYFIGEVFNGDVNYVSGYQETGIDGLADFPMYFGISEVFGSYKPATRLAELISQSSGYKNRYLMGTFIDNHDVQRFVNQVPRLTEEKLRQALTFEMTYTGIPVMYYGTEIAMKGGSDPDNRRDMDWSFKSPITDFVRKLTGIRKDNKALTHGDIKVLKAERSFLCYSRTFGDNTVLTAFNTADKEISAEFDIPDKIRQKGKTLINLLDSSELSVRDGKVSIEMAPRQVSVWTFKSANNKKGLAASRLITIAVVVTAAGALLVLLSRKRKRSK